MANLNVNIAQKLISYVRHGVDINDDIKELYNNSLIFIGDEGQIYVPAMNTYVGIGNTAYTNTIQRIEDVENKLDDLADTLSADLVSKIYPNYSLDELGGGPDINVQPQYAAENNVKMALTAADPSTGGVRDLWALNNEITIKGVYDYDASTGFAYTGGTGHQYVLDVPDDVDETELPSIHIAYQGLYHKNESANATSGIKVTPHWGGWIPVENKVTHQVINKRVGNYIEIDDKLTWSYMTSAYSYSLNFAQKYTASEVNRLYHNLLGDYEVSYQPIAFGTVITDATAIISELSDDDRTNYNATNPGKSLVTFNNSGTYTYYIVTYPTDAITGTDSGVYVATYTAGETFDPARQNDPDVITGDHTYWQLTKAQLEGLLSRDTDATAALVGSYVLYTDGNSIIQNFPQLYTRDTQYDSTYNMNIADGINTLKEVAYLLDQLSDGTLGTTTYLTYGQITAALGADPVRFAETGNDSAGYEYTYVDDSNEVRTLSFNNKWIEQNSVNKIVNWHSPKNSDVIAWYTKEADAENLGIQIAYSITGNKKEIDDLHSHTELAEKGETTLRSIQSTSTEFANITLLGGTTHWTDTDSKQGHGSFKDPLIGHPNYNTEEDSINVENPYYAYTSYSVGDVNIKVSLNTASVYATSYTADNEHPVNTHYIDEFGVDWYGVYTKADMNNLDTVGTYYVINTLVADTKDLEGNVETWGSATFNLGGALGTGKLSENEIDIRQIPTTIQYWWIPNYTEGNYSYALNNNAQNLIYKKITRAELLQKRDTDPLDNESGITKGGCTAFFIKGNDGEYHTAIAGITTQNPAQYALSNNPNVQSFYYIGGYEQTKIHAVHGENKIATTEWVGAFVEEKVGAIADDLENTLELAKQYTDEKIAALDNEYIYTDFSTYWTEYCSRLTGEGSITFTNTNYAAATGTTPAEFEFTYSDIVTDGSLAYTTTYAEFYEIYKKNTSNYVTVLGGLGNDTVSAENPYRLSYQSNSQYAYNIIEVDGIVTAQARELPSDSIKADAEIWGEKKNISSTAKHQYSDVVLPGQDKRRKDSLFDALYKWFLQETTPADNIDPQIFVQEFDITNGIYEYYPLTPGVVPNNILNEYANNNSSNYIDTADEKLQADTTLYEFVNGSFVQYNTATRFILPDYSDTDNKYWTQLYQRGYAYIELDFEDALVASNNGVPNKNIITIGDYTLTKDGSKVAVTKGGNSLGNLKYISTKAADSTKYFSVEKKHFSFENNGNGENELSVTAHITRIEDASKTNTGFADAFDVQTYIENYFTWIDISATVTEDTVSHSDKYYNIITLEEYNAIEGTKPQLYAREDKTTIASQGEKCIYYTALTNNTYYTAYYYKDDMTRYIASAASLSDAEAAAHTLYDTVSNPRHIPINGYYLFEQFFANSPESNLFGALTSSAIENKYGTASNYYIRIEDPKINPVNLTETKYGEPILKS